MGFLHENLHFLFMVLICLAGDGAWQWDGHSDTKLLVLLAKLFLVDCFYLSKVSAKQVQTTLGRQISKISTLFKIFFKKKCTETLKYFSFVTMTRTWFYKQMTRQKRIIVKLGPSSITSSLSLYYFQGWAWIWLWRPRPMAMGIMYYSKRNADQDNMAMMAMDVCLRLTWPWIQHCVACSRPMYIYVYVYP